MGRTLGVLWIGLAATVAAGCGASGKTVKVEGVVTLDGMPFAGASVSFVPLHEGAGRPAGGLTEEDGSFRLTTFRTDDGALPGEYKVTVKYIEPSGASGNPMKLDDKAKIEFFMRKSPEGRAKAKEAKKKQPRSPIPAIYGDVNKTPLREVVPTDGRVEVSLRSNMS